MTDWRDVQAFMATRGIDAWLVHDFRGSNPVLARLLPAAAKAGGGSNPGRHVTRRADLLVPGPGAGGGEPVLLCSVIDAGAYADVPAMGVRVETYQTREQWAAWVGRAVAGRRVAMEYSPGGALPVMAIVDAGTVEAVRAMGAEVVSSADLVQHAVARWSADAVAQHARASAEVAQVKDEAFALIGARHRAGQRVLEHEVAGFIRERFAALGLQWPDGPIVGVNEHAADPHYEPLAEAPTAIEPGDWVLIDLWARRPGDENIYSDITWVGFCAHGGRAVPVPHARVFDTVKAARDAALRLHASAHAAGTAPAGWELDQAARDVILAAGFERGLRHRTGHSLSPGKMVHGVGANLDNSETRDTRLLLPGLGYTIEPGIYLPSERVGVRLEINVYTDAERGPVVTSCVQDRPLLV